MRGDEKIVRTAIALCIGALGILPVPSQAQVTQDDWQFRAALYGWFPGFDGTTEFPSGAGGPSINVNANDLVANLKMAFMGNLQVQKGQWGALADWFYADIGDTKTGVHDFTIEGHPAGVATGNFSLDMKTNILTLAGTYAAVQKPEYSMNLVFGARMLNVDQTLDWAIPAASASTPLGGKSGTSNVDATNWDAIVGASGRYRFGEGLRWFTPYYVDIGTGNSQFTWQMILGVGYSFGWGDVIAAWRYTDYEFKSGDSLQSLTLQGPAIGVAFKW